MTKQLNKFFKLTKELNKFFKLTKKGMFFDYTRDFCQKFDKRSDMEISIKEILDFIDDWVDKKLPDTEIDNEEIADDNT